MPDAPASDTAMKFADYVLENYIAADSKFPPTLWTKPPDLLFPYTNNGAVLSHPPECWILCKASKHLRVCWCTEKDSRDSVFPRTACHNQHGSPNTSKRKQSLWCLPTTIIAYSISQERNFWRKYVIIMDREPNCDSALRVDFTLTWLLPCVFIHFCRAVSLHYSNAFSSSINAFS